MELPEALRILQQAGGYYECPKDSEDHRLGPLVGYAGRDAQGRQFVGDVYVNFARGEQHTYMLGLFAQSLIMKLHDQASIQQEALFLGAPMGGIGLAMLMAFQVRGQFAFFEKKVTALATEGSREKSELIIKRHEINEGQDVILVEDVCNNFSTTSQMINLVLATGAKIRAIACFLNRSLEVDDVFVHGEIEVPVVALVRKKIMQWSQDDPEVVADIAAGNVVWKAKNEWDRLQAAMNAHS